MKRVDHESTGACSGDGRRQTAGGAAAAVQASKRASSEQAGRWLTRTGRQTGLAHSSTRTLSRDKRSGGEGNAGWR
jgi:hypothetical protein